MTNILRGWALLRHKDIVLEVTYLTTPGCLLTRFGRSPRNSIIFFCRHRENVSGSIHSILPAFFPSAPLCLIKFFKVFNVPHSLHLHSSEDSKIRKCYGGSLVKNNLTWKCNYLSFHPLCERIKHYNDYTWVYTSRH